jgi:RimJ/RimL family protein N-acetyltransferase
MLSAEHATALERLAADPGFSTLLGGSATDFISKQTAAREAGSAFGFAIIDRGTLVGVCLLSDVGHPDGPLVRVCIGQEERRKGYGTFGVRMMGELAFRNLGVAQIRAVAGPEAAEHRVLEKNGFEASTGSRFEVSREGWQEFRDAPALAALHPDLKTLLVAELVTGNEVLETGGGWPDPDSVFVRLKHPFMARPPVLPDGVVYTEPGDPHWWKADYTTRSPRHILAC